MQQQQSQQLTIHTNVAHTHPAHMLSGEMESM